MKTRDPDHPGAQGLSPIKPGTLCLTIQSLRTPIDADLCGLTATVEYQVCRCSICGVEWYEISAMWAPQGWMLHRTNLQPILPPGIDAQIERAIGNPQLEVV